MLFRNSLFLAAGIRNLTVLSTILLTTVTNNDKNDKMTRPHVHLRGGGGKQDNSICRFNFHALAVSEDLYD